MSSALVAATTAAGCVPAASPARPRPLSTAAQAATRVIVIGGGLAGLAIAHALARRRFEIKVLEAKERPGGRILTLRSPFHEGLFVEAGATHVVCDPDLLALCAELGVAVEKRAATRGLAQVSLLGGRRIVTAAGQPPPRRWALSAEEEALGDSGRMHRYLAEAETFDPTAALPSRLRRLDAVTGADHLRSEGASPGFVSELDAMLGVGDRGIGGMSALGMMEAWSAIRRESKLGPSLRIVGGSDRLPEALAARLVGDVIHGAAVTGVQQDSTGAQVVFRQGGAQQVLRADRVVIAIPPPLLRDLALQPALSLDKRRALAAVALESVTRVWVETARRFWSARGESGRVDTDLPCGPVRDESDGLPGDRGLLGLYLTRAESRRFATLPEAARLEAALVSIDAAQPGARAGRVAGASKCWDTDPFQRGAYVYHQPGQAFDLASVLARPEGRLHFAGDHTSHRPGFMHGALASARRVIGELG